MMAFDLDGYLKDAEVRREERQAAEEAKARQEAEAAKPWYEKLWGAASDFGDDLVDTMKERGETFADAYGRYIGAELDAIARANETGDYSGKYADTPELRASSVEALTSGIDLATTPVRMAAYHVTAPLRERVGAFLEQEANEGSEFAQDLRSTEAFVNYFMTPEEKLKKAREIEANTGISADSFLDDDIAYKEALKINDFTNKRKAAMQEDFSMETVWQEFPELREVAKMSPRDAALALHDIESVRQTHGIVEAFTHFLAVGEKQLELDNIGAKIMMGTADENDHARAAELKKMLEEDKKKNLPSFFDDPLSAMAGGVASSAPEMLDSIREGGAWAWAGMIASGAAGTAVEPGGGTAVLGAAGGVVGFLRGVFGAAARREGGRAAIRTMFGAAARREAGRTALRDASLWGLKGGTFYGMARPEAGRRFLEYSEMTDTDGNPLMTDAEARDRAALGGALNAGIELWNAGMFLKPLTRFAGKAGAQGIEKAAIEGIVNRAKYDLGKRESVAVFAKDQVKDVLKIAATETAEESAQSVSDDLIHNYIVASADGRAAEAYYSFADITAHAAVAGAEAVPAALGFGLAGGSLHLPGGAIRHAHRLSSEKVQEDSAVQTTVTGTIMLGRLQQVASSAKLKETAPDVQRKLIRAQVRGTGFENVYIDAAAALEKESGLADLKAVAKAAELSDAAVENAVQHGGYLFVPIEKYAQSDASPALLEAVSFAPEADSLARIKKNAKDLSDAVEEAQKKAVKTRIDISQTIAHEWFPEAPQHASEEVKARRKAEYEAAMSAITMNPTNPKQGWRLLHGGFIAERAALLQPATEVLERDVKNGSAAWVEDFKKEHGHAPTQKDLLRLAYRLMVGDAAAPKVEGWQTLTQEEMDSAKGQLDALNDRIRTMEDIESRMKEVDGSEIRMASGLSPEAYSVYRQLMASLKAIGGVQSKAARLNALLFARHADQYARVMREKNWEKEYTALDYYRDTFAVEHGERAQAGGFTQAAMQRSKAETLEDFSRRMRTPEAESGSRNKKFLRIISSSGTAVDVAQDDMLHIHHRHPEMTDADFALIQENMENFSRVHLDMTGKGDYGGKTILCKIKTPRGAAGVAYELLPTGRIFLKTAFFDKESSIDSWIRKNGTSKDLMASETEKRGDAASMLTGHPSRTDQSVGSLTPSVIQPLSLPMIQERLGIVNQATRFQQRAWHSSPYDFSAFDLGNAGTGVGQMAHGWGVHCAADRKTSEVYRGDDGRTYEVEIPEDDVLLDEQKSYDEQPQKVRKALDKLVRGLTMEQLENWNDVRRLGKAAVTAEIKEALSESDGMNIYGTISDLVDGQEEASKLLNQYGVKGIVYDDRQSGRGFVVFDDRAISIVEKFYQEKNENALAEQKEAVRRQYEGTALWMKAPNGVQTNLTEEQWLTVRTPAFKAWFGDWEQVATQRALAESTPLPISHVLFGWEGKELRKAAQKIYQNDYQKNGDAIAVQTQEGRHVVLGMRGFREIKNHSADALVLKIVSNLREIVKNGRFLFTDTVSKENNSKADNTKAFHYYAAKVDVDGKAYYVRFVVREYTNRSLYYDHDLTSVEAVEKDADLSTNPDPKSGGEKSTSFVKHSITQWWNDVNSLEMAGDVDENGEPLASSLAQNFSQEEKRTSQGEIAMQPDGKRLIRLFRTADESTFLHEMGHLFLMDLDVLAKIDDVSAKDLATVNEWAAWKEGAAKEYADTDWADEFRDHEAAILAALASGDALRIARAKEVWRHERFARGFELYLREGKAPSAGLRGVFRKFRMFLRKVYSFVQSLGGRPSLAVEAVMARMIAAEEEIQAALLDERYRPVEKLGGEETLRDLMGEDMEKLYAKWVQEAQEEAEDLLRAQVMKDLKREAREAYEEKVAKEREKKRAELEKEPVYLAEAALEKSGKAGEAILGHWYDSLEEYKEERAKRKSLETELTEYIEAYARDLDKKMLAEHLTEENIEKAMTSPKAFGRRRALEAAAMRRKERLMAYIGGEVAEAKKEVEEHLSAMKEDADEVAKKKLQAALERLKGSAKWSGEEYAEIEEIARAKTQEERMKKYEAFKAKHKERAKERVRKQAEEKRRRKDFEEEAWANERFFREQARLFLASLPISESCNPEFFRRKEKQHARAAAKAVAQRKWDKARAERENQAHAAACAYEATKNQEEMQKLTADVQKKLGARTVRIQATERYWLHHLAYLLGLKKSDVEKPEGALDLAELFDSYKDNLDLDAAAPTEILELLAREETSYKSMTLGQLRQTVNMLRALYTIGRDKNRVLSFAGKDFADVAQEILSSKTRLAPEGVKQHPVSPDTGGVGYSDWLAKAPGIGEQMALLAQKGMLNLMKPEVMIRLLGEEAHNYIYGTIERAQMKETKLLGESQDELLRIFSVYTKEERMTWKDRTIKAGGEKLTKENVLCLALNWGSEINRKRILDGIGEKLDVEAVLKEHVTEKDWKVVQQVWDFIDTFWKETAAVEEKLNGSRLGKVPAAPFSIRTADGAEIKLRGGYYPLKYNAEKSTQAKEHAAEEEAKRGAAGAKVLGAHRGHTKRRSEGEVKEPVLLEFDVLGSHVYDAAHNIAFRIAARDVHRILRQKDFKQYVASTYGLAFWNRLDQWALDVWAVAADGSDLAATALSRTMAAFRCNSTMAIMGYRLWPVIENATNIGPMMDKLGAAEAHAAVADYYGNKKSMDALLEKSLFMMNRINNMERDLRQDTHIFAPTYAPIEFLRDNAYWALAQTDLMLSKPLWCRAYKNAFAKALAAVNRENAENRRTYQEAQEEVERLRAEVYDLRKELFGLEEESKERRYMNPEQLKGSPYAGMSEREIEDEKERRKEEIKEKERAFYEAGHRLERAAALPIREGAELIEEAEMRSVQAADGAVRDVIGSGQTKDLSALQRSRNEAVKMFTSFYSYFNTQFNALLESHFKGKYSEEGAARVDVWMPLARSLIYRIVLVSILGAMGKFALGLEGDDDRARYRTVKDPKTGEKKKVEVPKAERFLRVLGKNLLSTTTGTMPFFRDFAGMVASKVFDGTTYGRNFELGSVVTRGLKQAQATMELIEKKGEQDLAREEKAAEERRKMQKMTPRRRRQYEDDKKYKKPKKEIGYIDVMKSGAQTISTLTAARTGVTNTIADGIFTVLQYMTDSMEKDPYYDRSMENVLRSVLFDKKLRAKEMPEKPKKHKDKRHRRGAR
jgi:hypothetical protein